MSSPLRELTYLLRRLGHLDFGKTCLQAMVQNLSEKEIQQEVMMQFANEYSFGMLGLQMITLPETNRKIFS